MAVNYSFLQHEYSKIKSYDYDYNILNNASAYIKKYTLLNGNRVNRGENMKRIAGID